MPSTIFFELIISAILLVPISIMQTTWRENASIAHLTVLFAVSRHFALLVLMDSFLLQQICALSSVLSDSLATNQQKSAINAPMIVFYAKTVKTALCAVQLKILDSSISPLWDAILFKVILRMEMRPASYVPKSVLRVSHQPTAQRVSIITTWVATTLVSTSVWQNWSWRISRCQHAITVLMTASLATSTESVSHAMLQSIGNSILTTLGASPWRAITTIRASFASHVTSIVWTV